MCVLTIKRDTAYQAGFSCCRLGHVPGVGLRVLEGQNCKLIFPNMVRWHIKLKEIVSKTGYTLNVHPSTGDLGVGSKGQISLNFFESVGICEDAPSTAHSSLILLLFKILVGIL